MTISRYLLKRGVSTVVNLFLCCASEKLLLLFCVFALLTAESGTFVIGTIPIVKWDFCLPWYKLHRGRTKTVIMSVLGMLNDTIYGGRMTS